MNFRISRHAQAEMERRGIPSALVEAVLSAPEQKVSGHGAISCYQSRVSIGGKPYLLRIMVDETKRPPVVATVYRTSKIAKYWAKT
jgi:hypothetical protein